MQIKANLVSNQDAYAEVLVEHLGTMTFCYIDKFSGEVTTTSRTGSYVFEFPEVDFLPETVTQCEEFAVIATLGGGKLVGELKREEI